MEILRNTVHIIVEVEIHEMILVIQCVTLRIYVFGRPDKGTGI